VKWEGIQVEHCSGRVCGNAAAAEEAKEISRRANT